MPEYGGQGAVGGSDLVMTSEAELGDEMEAALHEGALEAVAKASRLFPNACSLSDCPPECEALLERTCLSSSACASNCEYRFVDQAAVVQQDATKWQIVIL